MMALGLTALHLQIADFKFTHNFIICNQLPETKLIFGINIQKKFSLSYAWDKEKNCYIQNQTHMVYFLTDDSTPKGRDPNINIINGIHKIKGKTSVNILVSNYTNKHLTFHKGEYIGHLEPAVLDSTDQQEMHQTNSMTLKKMMSETVTPDSFNPACRELSTAVQNDLKLLLQEYELQFTKDETSIGTTPLTSMTIDTSTYDPVSQEPCPIAMKHY